jgi:hypothetical protein
MTANVMNGHHYNDESRVPPTFLVGKLRPEIASMISSTYTFTLGAGGIRKIFYGNRFSAAAAAKLC